MDEPKIGSADTYDVLLVEDNESDEALALRALRKLTPPPAVKVAHDGLQALTILMDGPAPRLVLLDLKLPRLSGLEVLEAMRQSPDLKSVPVIALSSSDLTGDLERCQLGGANGFVTKPVGYHEYNAAVASITTFWLSDERSVETAPAASRFTRLP